MVSVAWNMENPHAIRQLLFSNRCCFPKFCMFDLPSKESQWPLQKQHTQNSTFSTSQLPKVVRTWCVLYILTWKCASRHNCVHFFDIATSKSGPNVVCFAHFDLEMCFAPQRRAIFYLSSGQLAPHPPL